MTSPAASFPGNMAELDFVEAYAKSALRKPQMAADAALRALVFSESGDRAILAGLIAQELAEACRRLVAVYDALADRTHSVARSLLKPLPGQAQWMQFIQRAATISPEQMLRELNIGNDALEAAQLLRSQPELGELAGLVAAAETGNPMLLIPDLARRHVAEEVWLAGVNADGEPIASSFGAEEGDATTLADITADISTIARDFLMSYLNARRGAGRQP
ncbi:MAG: hypothetical protein AB7N24_15830 [Dehalococcoidia bacterium]